MASRLLERNLLRMRWPLIGIWLVIFLFFGYLSSQVVILSDASASLPENAATDLLEERDARFAPADRFAVVHVRPPPGEVLLDSAALVEMLEMEAAIRVDPEIGPSLAPDAEAPEAVVSIASLVAAEAYLHATLEADIAPQEALMREMQRAIAMVTPHLRDRSMDLEVVRQEILDLNRTIQDLARAVPIPPERPTDENLSLIIADLKHPTTGQLAAAIIDLDAEELQVALERLFAGEARSTYDARYDFFFDTVLPLASFTAWLDEYAADLPNPLLIEANKAFRDLDATISVHAGGFFGLLRGGFAQTIDLRTSWSVLAQELVPKGYSPADEGGLPEAILVVRLDGRLDSVELDDLEAHLMHDIEGTDRGVDAMVLGRGAVSEEVSGIARRAVAKLIPLAILVMIVILAAFMRTVRDVLVIVVGLGVLVTVSWGMGGLLGIAYTSTTMAVPILMLGLGIDFSIHLLLEYRRRLNAPSGVAGALDPVTAMAGSVRTLSGGLALAMLTTAAGFLTLRLSQFPMIRDFGLLAALGIAAALLVTLTLIPALVLLIDIRWPRRLPGPKAVAPTAGAKDGKRFRPAGLLGSRLFAAAVVLVVLGGSVGLLWAGQTIPVDADSRSAMPAGLERLERADEIAASFPIETRFTYLILDGIDVQDPAFWSDLAILATDLEMDAVVSARPLSILSAIDRYSNDSAVNLAHDPNMTTAMASADRDGDGVPDNSSAFTDLLETMAVAPARRRVLDRYLEAAPGQGALMVVPIDPAIGEPEVDAAIAGLIGARDRPGLGAIAVTGRPAVTVETAAVLEDSRILAFAIAVLATGTVLVIGLSLRRAPWLALAPILPLLLVIGAIHGTMLLLDLPYNAVTVLIAALAVGLGVDAMVHVLHRYAHQGSDRPAAIRTAVKLAGPAMLASAITTVAGFAILGLSPIPPMAAFGMLMALAIAFAYLAARFILPWFLVLLPPPPAIGGKGAGPTDGHLLIEDPDSTVVSDDPRS